VIALLAIGLWLLHKKRKAAKNKAAGPSYPEEAELLGAPGTKSTQSTRTPTPPGNNPEMIMSTNRVEMGQASAYGSTKRKPLANSASNQNEMITHSNRHEVEDLGTLETLNKPWSMDGRAELADHDGKA